MHLTSLSLEPSSPWEDFVSSPKTLFLCHLPLIGSHFSNLKQQKVLESFKTLTSSLPLTRDQIASFAIGRKKVVQHIELKNKIISSAKERFLTSLIIIVALVALQKMKQFTGLLYLAGPAAEALLSFYKIRQNNLLLEDPSRTSRLLFPLEEDFNQIY